MDASTNKPRRRVGRRFLLAVAGLILLAIAAVWLLPWLLMADDLRRMQGTWKAVRIEDKENPQQIDPGNDVLITIVGNRLRVEGNPVDHWIEIDPPTRRLHLYFYYPPASPATIMGIDVPIWLMKPPTCAVCEYEISERGLVLGMRGILDRETGIVADDPWINLHLAREKQ